MLKAIGRNRPGVLGGLLAFLVFVVVELVAPAEWMSMLRERAFDAVLSADLRLRRLAPAAQDGPAVVVVDIDQRTIAALGDWPWPRETMARLVGAVAEAKPKALAIDVLFAGADMRSSATPAHRPDNIAQNSSTYALAASVAEGDQQLATVISSVSAALGATLDTNAGAVPRSRGVAVLRRGPVMLADVWRAPGAIDPVAPLADAAAGIGIMSLPGDADGKVRRVPLLVGVGDALRPGLAVEAVRLAQPASTLIVEADPQRLLIGNLKLALPADGFLRLAPGGADRQAARTISALDVVQGAGKNARLAGAIVLIGGSAPELGNGLRDTPHDPLMPSVQIEAGAVEQIAAQRAPLAAPGALHAALTLGLAIIALALAVSAAPVAGTVLAIAAIGAAWLGAIALSLSFDRLLDPLMPSIGAAMTFMTASIGSFVAVSRREARIRNRFAQHLAPEVVRRIAENPEMLKLRAEKRDVTALFTDIEGFTSMTHRAGPEQLVAELDGYIEGVATIIMDHGGMVDKIVGDAVHALFNAPIDLADHVTQAVASAIEIRKWSEQYRARQSARQIGFGRTRIGIETGDAVVGDIGIRSKLDYTAHGDAINSAARLEALNKDLGSSICIGPVAASRCVASTLRPLGTVALRGLEQPIAIFEPWPEAASPAWRARYLAANEAARCDPAVAAAQFDSLAAELPADPVAAGMARRLREGLRGE
jgi:adenylate cyclase